MAILKMEYKKLQTGKKMDIFKELIQGLTPLLKSMGFSKRGNNFYLEADKNLGIVNFQKSQGSTKDIVKFTINFGVYSGVLGQSQYHYNTSAKPGVERCHWQARVGSFMPGGSDYWWSISASDNLSGITANITETIQRLIVPELNKRLTDEGLIKAWMNNDYAGTTEIGRFKYLTILLKAKEDFDKLNHVVESFMQRSNGKPIARWAIEHLQEIEYNK